jgi:hypothetical protein
VNGYDFDYWILDWAPQEARNMELTLTMDKARIATARYTATTDLNIDGHVGETDIFIVAGAFQSKIGESNYYPSMDFDDNGVITIIDVATVAKDFNETT